MGEISTETGRNRAAASRRSRSVRARIAVHAATLTIASAAGAGDAPASVWASQIVGESGVDVAMRAQLQFANGLVAQISSGFRTPFREALHIVGDQGSLQVAEPWKPGV